MLSFSTGIQANFLRWKYEPFSGNTLKTTTVSLFYAQLGVPLTLDYKWGCDVDFDPEKKLCFAVGGGLIPMAGLSFSNFESSQLKFRTAPYLYASVGFFAHGCWKIRASYLPGSYTVFKNASEDIGDIVKTLNVQGSDVISIGICLMDFSRDWGRASGYRTGSHGSGGGGRRHRNYEGTRLF